jgi:hypothetical protein
LLLNHKSSRYSPEWLEHSFQEPTEDRASACHLLGMRPVGLRNFDLFHCTWRNHRGNKQATRVQT